MNRIDFMSRLSLLLSDLPESERAEALQYYEDYLNDAGVENEEEVLKSLGTPEELAASIREGLKEDSGQQGEFSEKGFWEKDMKPENEVARRDADRGRDAQSTSQRAAGYGSAQNSFGQRDDAYSTGQTNRHTTYSSQNRSAEYRSQNRGAKTADSAADLDRRYRSRERRKGMSGGMVALLVILCILAVPVVIPVVFALAVVVVVLAFVAVILAGVFLFVGVICVIAGVLAFAGAVAKLFIYPAGAVLTIGISLLTIGIGILLTLAIGWVIAKVFPKAFNGLVNFVSGLVHRKGGNAA